MSCGITAIIFSGSMRKHLESFWQWCRLRRRRIIAVLLVIAFFYGLGYFTTPQGVPGTCLVYG